MTEKKKNDNSKYNQLDDSQLNWLHILFQWINIRILSVYFRLKYDFHVHGREHKPKGLQSYLIACNHVSSADPPMVGVAIDFQPVSFMAKVELFQNYWMRTYNWWVATFAVNREKLELSTVKSALKVLKHGKWALCIFPEGTRNKEGKIKEAKRGVAYFAQSAKVPIMPMSITHTPPPPGKKGKLRVDIRIGPMIPYDPNVSIDELTQKVQASIATLIEEAKSDQCQTEPPALIGKS
jgi:1-acyl-sn-glycerol-3-phosphate acyltransferase